MAYQMSSTEQDFLPEDSKIPKSYTFLLQIQQTPNLTFLKSFLAPSHTIIIRGTVSKEVTDGYRTCNIRT
jgi:hypothetical protein